SSFRPALSGGREEEWLTSASTLVTRRADLRGDADGVEHGVRFVGLPRGAGGGGGGPRVERDVGLEQGAVDDGELRVGQRAAADEPVAARDGVGVPPVA